MGKAHYKSSSWIIRYATSFLEDFGKYCICTKISTEVNKKDEITNELKHPNKQGQTVRK